MWVPLVRVLSFPCFIGYDFLPPYEPWPLFGGMGWVGLVWVGRDVFLGENRLFQSCFGHMHKYFTSERGPNPTRDSPLTLPKPNHTQNLPSCPIYGIFKTSFVNNPQNQTGLISSKLVPGPVMSNV